MQREMIDQWAALSKSALESMQELGEINAKLVKRMTAQQEAILSACLEASAKEMNLVGVAKDAQDLLAKQADLASEYGAKFVEIVRGTNDLLSECKNELSAWADRGMEKTVAPFAGKPAKTK
ncbi:MAG: phasin family protein [Gammaproteobacteria bacterium]